MIQNVFHDGDSFLHVLAQTGDRYAGIFVTEADVVVAGEVIHFTVDLAKRTVLAFQLIKEVVGDTSFLVV